MNLYCGAARRSKLRRRRGALAQALENQRELIDQSDTGVALGVFFGMEAEFWLNLQAHHDLVHAREALADRLAEITPLAMAA